MKKNKKINYTKYAWGGNVDPNVVGNIAGLGGNLLGAAVGQDTDAGGFLSGAGSGAGLGASIGSVIPGIGTAIGAIGGGLIGGIAGIFGSNKKQKAEKARKKAEELATRTNYNTTIESQFDTVNSNPYGNLVFANGGEVLPNEVINIEKGELQIDPATGKVLRKYTGINPETGGLYEPHSKGKDTKNNFVTAEPGTFIITSKESKDYQQALDNNDKITQNTILQNIKNYKNSKKPTDKMALGSFVDPTKPPYLSAQNPMGGFNPNMLLQQSRGLLPISSPSANTGIQSPGTAFGGLTPTRPFGQVGQTGMAPSTTAYTPQLGQNGGGNNTPGIGSVLNSIAQYAPSLINIGRGMFGKVEQQQNVQPLLNPYTNQVLNNMPEEISLNPLARRIDRNQSAQFRQINNTTSSDAIARANKNNVFANTQNQLADVYMQQEQANNQIRQQRGSIYNNLGQQSVEEQARAQQINLGIYNNNLQNKGAQQNLLSTGLGQLQQVYQNQQMIGQQKTNDALRQRMLYEMFPNLRFYENTFNR